MKKITRKDLYEKVWQTPMRTLAPDFGLSDQGLAKICARHNIPRPPRGYWAKKEAGIEVPVAPLPNRPSDTQDLILIRPASQSLKVGIAVQKTARAARPNISSPDIPDDLRGLHRIVAGWVSEHKNAQAKRRADIRAARRDSWFGRNPIIDLTERDRYRFRVTSSLLKGLEAAGGKAREGRIRGDLTLECSGQKIEMTVIEKMRQQLSKPSKEDRQWTAYPDHHNAALFPTGCLRFTVNTYFGGGMKKEWVETEKKKASDILPDIIGGLLAIGPALVALEQKRAEEHQRYEEERLRRAEERRLAEIEESRWQRFRKLADDWQEARRLREFLFALEQEKTTLNPEIDGLGIDEYLIWARDRIQKLDPL